MPFCILLKNNTVTRADFRLDGPIQLYFYHWVKIPFEIQKGKIKTDLLESCQKDLISNEINQGQ